MSSDWIMFMQLAGLVVFGTLLLVFWGDLGGFAFVKRTSSGVKFALGLVAIAGMIGALIVPRSSGPIGNAGGGPAADLNWRLLNVADDKEIDLASLKGRVLFINIWATWCGPCVQEMPSIERLYSQFAGRDDVAFLLISSDDTLADARRFAGTREMKTPIYVQKSSMPGDFRTRGIPATFIIAKDGTKALAEVGGREWDGEGPLIEKLAKAAAPSAEAKQ